MRKQPFVLCGNTVIRPEHVIYVHPDGTSSGNSIIGIRHEGLLTQVRCAAPVSEVYAAIAGEPATPPKTSSAATE